MNKSFLYVIGFGIILSSCGNPASDLANEMCDCIDEMGLTNRFNAMSGMDVDPEEHECTKDVAEQILEELKDKGKDDRVAFMQDLSKALIDTECGEDALGMIPYDKVLEQFEENLDEIGGFRFGEIEVCDCVEMGDEMREKMKEADGDEERMHEIEEEYKSEMEACEKMVEDASDEEKEEIMREAEEC